MSLFWLKCCLVTEVGGQFDCACSMRGIQSQGILQGLSRDRIEFVEDEEHQDESIYVPGGLRITCIRHQHQYNVGRLALIVVFCVAVVMALVGTYLAHREPGRSGEEADYGLLDQDFGNKTSKIWNNRTSLFCFMVVQQGSMEVRLAQFQFKKKCGIFECNHYAVYSDAPEAISLGFNSDGTEEKTIPIPGPPALKGLQSCLGCHTQKTYIMNANVLMRAWDKAAKDGIAVTVSPESARLGANLSEHSEPPLAQPVERLAPYPMGSGSSTRSKAGPVAEAEVIEAAEPAEAAEAVEVAPAAMKKKGAHLKKQKQEAGARMAAAHHERMENFTLPTGACQPSEDDEHCMDCFQMAFCQHPYCGTCSFCKPAGGGFDPSRELLDYQCMCMQCARAMNRCCACGKAFNGKPIEVTLPLQHAPGNDDEAGGVLLPDEDGEIGEDWSKRMAAALEVAREYSGFSKFHDTYPPLFEELWDKYDAEHTGYIKAADAEAFAKDMVASGWKDWAPSERDCSLWKQIEEEFGGISLEQFAEMSENDDFAV
eukprot:s980_g16.t1